MGSHISGPGAGTGGGVDFDRQVTPVTADRETCFVIMPLARTSVEHSAEYWNNHFESFLRPLIEENPALRAVRSQGLGQEGNRDDLGESVTSRLVVADATDLCPSVFWELGARQAMGYDAIVIAQEGTAVPFNAGSGETLFYSNDYPRMARFIRAFTESLEGMVRRADTTDGLQPTEARGEKTYLDIFKKHETLRRLDALVYECESNIELVRSCVEQNKANEGKDGGFFGVADPIRTYAIDLLITKRYLERDSTFYQLVEDTFSGLKTYSESIFSWPGDPGQFGPWLVENGRNLEDLLKELVESLKGDISGLTKTE